MKPIETLDSREVAESSLRAKAKSNLQMIGQDSHANWVVRDLAGQRGGLFVNRGEALRFTMLDDNGGPRAVVMAPVFLSSA
jgi:hypothetical protein